MKSTINKGRTVAIKAHEEPRRKLLGGKSIQSNVFFALLGRTKSIDASGAVTVKKFISYFTKHDYDSSISSDDDSAVDGDSSATEDESKVKLVSLFTLLIQIMNTEVQFVPNIVEAKLTKFTLRRKTVCGYFIKV